MQIKALEAQLRTKEREAAEWERTVKELEAQGPGGVSPSKVGMAWWACREWGTWYTW